MCREGSGSRSAEARLEPDAAVVLPAVAVSLSCAPPPSPPLRPLARVGAVAVGAAAAVAAAAAAEPDPSLDLDDLMDAVEAEVEVSLEALPRRHGSMEAADIRPVGREHTFYSRLRSDEARRMLRQV